MPRYRYPIKANVPNTLYCLYIRFLKLAPVTLLMTMLFLLVGFSVATGYLIKSRDARMPAPPSPRLLSVHLAAAPGVAVASSEKSGRHFAIALGAYVLKRNFDTEKKFADRLDQPLQIKIGDKKVNMIRLYLGTFPKGKATTTLNELKTVAPDAFLVQQDQGSMAAVYAGSYYYQSKAGNLQKALARKGFATKQVSAKVTMPLYCAYMGNFDSQEKALAFIRTVGLPESKMPVVVLN